MEVLFISDIHVEFHKDKGKAFIEELPMADVVSIAGDLGNSKTMVASLTRFCQKYPKVIYVLGNHDCFSSFVKVNATLQDLKVQFPNLYWLENERIVIDDQAFIGCTLWYKPDDRRNDWVDFNYIYDSHLIEGKHFESVSYLRNNIQEGDIVITHMMPSYKCVSPRFIFSEWNNYFTNNLDDIIEITKPKIWHYGHTHDKADFYLHNTRMLCNPYGYKGREIQINNFFNKNLILNTKGL